MKRLWQRHPVLVSCFALALVLSLSFGVRAVMVAARFQGAVDRPVAGWMTPRYIVTTYNLPNEVVAKILDLPPHTNPRLPLETIARSQGRDLRDLTDALDAAIVEAHSE